MATPPTPTHRRLVLAVAGTLLALLAAGAWLYTHGGRRAPENVTAYPLDGQFAIPIENLGDTTFGDEIPLQLGLVVSEFGRRVTVVPNWPRAGLDPRRCFVPDIVHIRAEITGKLGFVMQFTAAREGADQPWRVEARFRGGAPRPVVPEKQPPNDPSRGTETFGSADGCPRWNVHLPRLAVQTGLLRTSGNGGTSALESAAWKAATVASARAYRKASPAR